MMEWIKKLDRKEAEMRYREYKYAKTNDLATNDFHYIYWFTKDGKYRTLCVHCHSTLSNGESRRICKNCLKLDVIDRFKVKAKPMFMYPDEGYKIEIYNDPLTKDYYKGVAKVIKVLGQNGTFQDKKITLVEVQFEDQTFTQLFYILTK